jgi:hypothetical protein
VRSGSPSTSLRITGATVRATAARIRASAHVCDALNKMRCLHSANGIDKLTASDAKKYFDILMQQLLWSKIQNARTRNR